MPSGEVDRLIVVVFSVLFLTIVAGSIWAQIKVAQKADLIPPQIERNCP